jgi:hypothetical protein
MKRIRGVLEGKKGNPDKAAKGLLDMEAIEGEELRC